METLDWKSHIQSFDERRDVIVPGDARQTVLFAVQQLIQLAQEAIKERGIFTIAFSGGSTPHAIFKELNQPNYSKSIDWSKVLCFWSDERSAPPTTSENNYFSAMEAGLATLPLLPTHVFRMQAEKDIEKNALAYENLIREKIPSLSFDLIMLGMGEDGHTASLFPHTHGLHVKDRLVIANYVPQKNTWRMSFTFACIEMARLACIYVMGKEKKHTLTDIFLGSYNPDTFPSQRVGIPSRRVVWVLDQAAAEKLLNFL